MVAPDFNASWWLKLERAKKHLHDIDDLLDRMRDPKPGALRVEKERQGAQWVYTVHHDIKPDRMLPLVISDYLFNLRSALDHIAAANVRPTAFEKSQFPIFTEDFRTFSPGEPQRFKGYRDSWKDLRKRMTPAVFAAIEEVQPFQTCLKDSSNPNEALLALLNDFQNTDKHRQLGVIDAGLLDPSGFVFEQDGTRLPIIYNALPKDSMLQDGATCHVSDTDVGVEFYGVIQVAVTGGANQRYMPTENLSGLWEEVFAVLRFITGEM
jgi:hypothetical protein